MASIAGPSSSSSSPSSFNPKTPIDIIDLFNAPVAASTPPRAMAAASASSSSQQISLSSVFYDVDLIVTANGKSELCFEETNRRTTLQSWKFYGRADVVASTLCCCFSADSKYFIAAGNDADYNIRLWNPSTRNLVATLAGHTSNVFAVVSFYLNEKVMVASGSNDKTIRIWELKDSASSSLCVTTLQSDTYVYSLTFSPKHHLLISGQTDGTIMFWSPSNWQCIQTLSASSFSPVYALSLSSDESKLASGHQDGSIHIWDMASRTEIKTWKAATKCITLNGLCFSPSQPDILVAASFDGTCSTWNCITGAKIGGISSQSNTGSSPALFSSNGKYIVTVSSSNQLTLVDSSTSTVFKTMDGCPSVRHISSACFSPDNKYLACATRDASKSFHLWMSSSIPSPAVNTRLILGEIASDFRLVPLSESTCLVVVRLDSNKWALTMVESSSKGIIVFDEWSTIPSSIRRPVITFPASDGHILKIGDKDHIGAGFTPLFIGKYADLLSESASALAHAYKVKEEALERKELCLRHDFEEKSSELEKKVSRAQEEANKKLEQARMESAKLQSYLVKQENGMDAVLLELLFGTPSDASSPLRVVEKCKSILESHLSSSMSELRSICSSSSASSLPISKSSSAPQKEADTPVMSDVIDWSSFSIGKEIGKGGFGSVFTAELKLADGQKRPVAVKVPARTSRQTLSSIQQAPQEIPAASSAEKAVLKSIQNEIASYKRIDHPNVVRYLGCTMEPSPSSPICIVQQYCASGDLQSLLATTKPDVLSEKFAFQTVMQIASGMSSVHQLGVVHCDLKPANILLCSFPSSSLCDITICKVTDCGSAALKDLNNELSRVTGNAVSGASSVNGFTSRYCPPELVSRRLKDQWKDSYAQDLWAFGLILFQLRTGTIPFAEDTEQTVVVSIAGGEEPGVWPQEDGDSWDWLHSLASQCLELQPRDRLAHFEAIGASADGRTAFAAIEKKLCEVRPEWAKEVMANMLKFQRIEIRDPFLKDQLMAGK